MCIYCTNSCLWHFVDSSVVIWSFIAVIIIIIIIIVVGGSFVFFLMPTLFPFPLPEATNAVAAIAFHFLGAIVQLLVSHGAAIVVFGCNVGGM